MTTLEDIRQHAISTAQNLAEGVDDDDVDPLYILIGKQERAIDVDPVLAFDPALTPQYEKAMMGPLDGLKELGRRIARKWARALHDLICGGKDDAARKQLFDALSISEAATIGAVTTLLLPVLSPPIAAAVAVVIVKRFLGPVLDETCTFWSEQLDDPA